MKIKTREVAFLLLPSVGLLGVGAVFQRLPAPQAAPATAPKAYISIQPPIKAPSWSVDGGVSARIGLHFGSPYLVQRPPVRWYLNCRIEGTLQGRRQVFYSSGGHDPYGCLASSTYLSRSPRTHILAETFLLRRLPAAASDLTLRVEAVALEGTWSVPQEMTRGELMQARRSPRLLGYASNSVPLFPEPKRAPSATTRPTPQLLPYELPTPKASPNTRRSRSLKYLQAPPGQML